MSESYFPNHHDANAYATQSVGYPGAAQAPFDQFSTPGHPMSGEHPSNGYAAPPAYGQGQSHGTKSAPLPRQIVAALAVAAVLVLVLGGLAFQTHAKLGHAQTKADGLAQSLDKANKSVAAKQSELQSTQKELETTQQQGQQLDAAYKVAASCATQLDAVFNMILNSASSDQISAAYQNSREACDQLAQGQSSQ
jgi:hypothetical protein